jgi:hypothetical protein
MEQELGYFCRAFDGQDVQANVIARTLREAELEITRMIRSGAMAAHAVQHGRPDHEPELVAGAHGGIADGELWRYLRQSAGPEFDRWQTAYLSKTKIMDDRWVVIELSETGIKEYGAFGKAVRAVWGSASTSEPSDHTVDDTADLGEAWRKDHKSPGTAGTIENSPARSAG